MGALAGLTLLASLTIGVSPAQAVPTAAQAAASDTTRVGISIPIPKGDPAKAGKVISGDPSAAFAKTTGSGAKGRPPVPPSHLRAKRTPGAVSYIYAGGKQRPTTPPTGVSSLNTVSTPYINPTWDYHTLNENAVQSADEQQAVEVGVTRDQSTNGDNKVRLFVYHWVNGQETCYNGCGWVDNAANTTFNAGADLTAYANANTEMVFQIERTATAWWIGFGPNDGTADWIGNFPDTIWTGATPSVTTFKQVDFFQTFGEVAAGTPATCADMGLGPTPVMATPTAGARLSNVTYSGQPSTNVVLNAFATQPTWYQGFRQNSTATPPVQSTRTIRYGGPGSC